MRTNTWRVLGAAALSILVFAGRPGCESSKDQADWSAADVPGTDLVLAEVNGQPITAGYVYHKIRIQYPQMPNKGASLGKQAAEVIKQAVQERCFDNLAASQGWDEDPEYLRMMALSQQSLISRVAISRAITARATPGDLELRKIYDADPDRFLVKARVWYRHILLDSESDARRVLAELRAGADFADMAKRYSRDAVSAARGGEMPPGDAEGQAGHLGKLPELTAAAMALSADEIGGPVRTAKGWHVIKSIAKREDKRRTFEEVRDEIAAKERSRVESRVYGEVMDSLKNALNVVYHEENIEEFARLQMDAEQLFTAAQQEDEAQQKVAIYRQILERFPESGRCPEALFMIGFELAEHLADTTRAVETFERFLADYPQHEMAASARLMLNELRSAR